MHLALCAAWIALAGVYASFACEARASLNSTLPRAGFRIPSHHKVPLGNPHLEQVLNSLAQKYDASMLGLERALRNSAQTRLRVDGSAAVLSLIGLAGQIAALRRLARTQRTYGIPIPIFRRDSASRLRPIQPAKLHEGSFPEGGYAS